jgi:hypothetical protein
MKLLGKKCVMALLFVPLSLYAADTNAPVVTAGENQAEMVRRYDLNNNGKIDANEHKAFARAIAKQRSETRKKEVDEMKRDPVFAELRRRELAARVLALAAHGTTNHATRDRQKFEKAGISPLTIGTSVSH